jgi:hypothetical protein
MGYTFENNGFLKIGPIQGQPWHWKGWGNTDTGLARLADGIDFLKI